MIHGIPVEKVIERLENLKRRSLLENLGDGLDSIGMHDLWREFARLETNELDEFGKRRWILEPDEHSALEEVAMTQGGDVSRMLFLSKGLTKLEDLNFACFPHVTVLKLCTDFASAHELDLKGLKLLKSLELECDSYRARSKRLISVVGLGSLLKLGFLRWLDIPSNSPCVAEIAWLTNLRVLDLYGCGELPDLSRLILLEVASFRENDTVKTIVGLSSNHTNLKFLDLSGCGALLSCPGVGELVALQELRLNSCSKLTEVPNLQKLKRLRKLHMHSCSLLRTLPGLGDLVNLLELHVVCCRSLEELPNIGNLKYLRILDLQCCRSIKSLPGINELVCLQSLKTCGCYNLTDLPDICTLTNLQTLELDPSHPLQSYFGSRNLISLESVGINELHDEPDLSKLTQLKRLYISGYRGRGFLSLTELVMLESVVVYNCKGVLALPNLKRLSRLRELDLRACEFENLFSLIKLTSLEELRISNCRMLKALPKLQNLGRLKELRVERCEQLQDFRGLLALRKLKRLYVRSNPWVHENLRMDLFRLTSLRSLNVSNIRFAHLEGLAACSQLRTLDCSRCRLLEQLPDLSSFPNFSSLVVSNCVYLRELTCDGLLSAAFSRLDVHGCHRLRDVPDLTNSRRMQLLVVSESGVKLDAQLIDDMKARWPSMLLITGEEHTPDVPLQFLDEQFQFSFGSSGEGSPHVHFPELPHVHFSHGSSRGFWRRWNDRITSLWMHLLEHLV